jgi:hypothetical protein
MFFYCWGPARDPGTDGTADEIRSSDSLKSGNEEALPEQPPDQTENVSWICCLLICYLN